MSVIFSLVNRNLKVYLRNRTAVFFSFLSVLIIIGLYALFLGQMQVAGVRNQVGDIDGIDWLIYSWLMAGVLAVNTVTIMLGNMGTIVTDIEMDISKDFIAAPIKRSQVVLGYIVSSWIVTFILTILTFVIFMVFIMFNGGEMLSLLSILKALFVIILSIISFSSVLFYIITYIKSLNAFGTLSTILGITKFHSLLCRYFPG